VVDVVRRQPLDPEQMSVPERGLGGASVHEPGTMGRVPPPYNSENEVSSVGKYRGSLSNMSCG
jgi:hypothetical protein